MNLFLRLAATAGIVAAGLALSACVGTIASTAVGTTGKVAGATVGAAGHVAGAAIPGGGHDD
jgi:hypothetical protein